MEEKTVRKSTVLKIAVAMLSLLLAVAVAGLCYIYFSEKECNKECTCNKEVTSSEESYAWRSSILLNIVERTDEYSQGEEKIIRWFVKDAGEFEKKGYTTAYYEKISDKEYVVAIAGAFDSYSFDIFNYKTGELVKHYDQKYIGYLIENNEIVVYSLQDAKLKGYVVEVNTDTPYYTSNNPSFKTVL